MFGRVMALICVVIVSQGLGNEIRAQVSVKDSAISMVMLRPSYGIQLPGGDLASRFGVNQTIGMAVTYKHKSGWMFTAEGDFFFGNLCFQKPEKPQ